MRREVGDGRQRPAASWPRRSTRSAAVSHLRTHRTSTPRSHMVSNKGELGACTQAGILITDHSECKCAHSERRGSPLSMEKVHTAEGFSASPRVAKVLQHLLLNGQRLGRWRRKLDWCTCPDLLRAPITLAFAAGGRPTLGSDKTDATTRPRPV